MKLNRHNLSRYKTQLVVAVILVVGGVLLIVARPTNPDATPNSTVSSDAVPAGFREYAREDIGIRLAYPEAWGEPSTKSFRAYHSDGQPALPYLVVSFDKEPNAQVTFPSKDGVIPYITLGLNFTGNYYYSHDFSKTGEIYCFIFAGKPETDCQPLTPDPGDIISAQEQNSGGIRSLLANYRRALSFVEGVQAFSGHSPIIRELQPNQKMQVVELLAIFNPDAVYSSVTVEVFGAEQADMNDTLEQVEQILPTIKKL